MLSLRRRVTLPIVFVVANIMTLAPSRAADSCKDILVDGTLKNVNWKEKSYYQNLLYARFASLNYQQSKSDMALSAPVPIGKAVIGKLDYSQSEFDERRNEIENTLFKQLTDSRELAVVISSGDDVIVGAWKDCISRRGGGLVVSVKPVTTTVADVSVEYFAVGTQYETTLDSDADFLNDNGRLDHGDVEIIDNERCLKKGARLAHNAGPCTARIKLREAKTAVVVALRTVNNLSEHQYLPPRLRAGGVETKPYPFTEKCGPGHFPAGPQIPAGVFNSFATRCPDYLFRSVKRGTASGSYLVTISEADRKEHWQFASETANISVQRPRGNGHRGNKCNAQVDSVSATSLAYSTSVYSGPKANMSIVCYVVPTILMQRDTYVEGI